MENKIRISAKNNSRISFDVIPGHFATNHSHVSSYIDMNTVKSSYKEAKEAAKELSGMISSQFPVESIICIEGTRMIGAFIAEELSGALHGFSSGNDISVITPEFDMNNQIILRDNMQELVRGKNVLLLVSSVSSGKSIRQAIDCLAYYGGYLGGAAAIFSDVEEIKGVKINHIFGADDIPAYTSHRPEECPMCKNGQKIDAIVNSFGYSKI